MCGNCTISNPFIECLESKLVNSAEEFRLFMLKGFKLLVFFLANVS